MKNITLLLAFTLMATSLQAGPICDTDDTDHTSDKRGTWQCPNACVIAFGNPLNRSYEVKGGEHRRFEINWNKRAVSVDGKRCKELPQTYIYK
jgi:hypothetical protein